MIRVSRGAGSWLLLLLLLALLAFVATGCTSRPSSNAPAPDRPARVDASDDAFSVYDLGGTWHDQAGAVRCGRFGPDADAGAAVDLPRETGAAPARGLFQ